MSLNNGVPIFSTPPDETTGPDAPRRVFVHEPGWRISIKRGSEREFCYMMAPGQDYYHRLLDGELYLFHGDERLCLSCAIRRGIISFEPRRLREPARQSPEDSGELPDLVEK